MKLSIIVLNWNTKELTLAAVAAAMQETTGFPYEIILIDNNSSDDSVAAIRARFPTVRVIENQENVGFGKANNQGMRIAAGEYIMLLNSDTVVLNHALEKMARYLDEHPDVMMVGPKVLNADRTFQHSCRRSLPTPRAAFFHLFGLTKLFPKSKTVTAYKRYADEPNRTEPVEAISGAAMMFRREVFVATGGFDEQFFMYAEDLDLCKQVYDRGWITMFLHTAEIIHYGGASSKKRRTASIKNFYDAMWLYYKKHWAMTHPLVQAFIWLGIRVRLWLALTQNFLKKT